MKTDEKRGVAAIWRWGFRSGFARLWLLGGGFASGLLVGCAHAPPSSSKLADASRPIGRSVRPFGGMPDYLEHPPDEATFAPAGPVGRYSPATPIAGKIDVPAAGPRDEVRLRLARIDASAVALREEVRAEEQAMAERGGRAARVRVSGRRPTTAVTKEARSSVAPDEVAALRQSAGELSQFLAGRPDLTAESDELRMLIEKLDRTTGLELGRMLDRIGELTDLIRVQIDATT